MSEKALYVDTIEESAKGHRLVLPLKVRKMLGKPKKFRLRVIDEGGKRKILLEPLAT